MSNSFYENLDRDFLKLVAETSKLNFSLGIVGGCVRDFFLNISKDENQPNDYDCELRPIKDVADLELCFSRLVEKLKTSYIVEELPYRIIRIRADSYTAELSLPRVEKFNEEFHHSNFEASFIADKGYNQGFQRRDLTINSIMMEISEGRAVMRDPMGGRADLDNSLLKPCSRDFSQDPVRFLRALRFRILLNKKTQRKFRFSDDLTALYAGLSLDQFSAHYLSLEAMKSESPLSYIFELISLIDPGSHPVCLKQEMVQDIDNLWRENGTISFLKNLYPVSHNMRIKILKSLNFKNIKDQGDMPWLLKENEVDDLWISRFKTLEALPDSLINVFFKYGFIDLDKRALMGMRQIQVGLDHVQPDERSHYSFKEKMRRYLES